MTPVISAAQAGRDLLCCMGLGCLTAALRSLFPLRGRWAFWPDFLAVGLALMLLQGYAAGRSSAGALRWYMAAGAVAGAAGFEQTLGGWLERGKRAVRRAAAAPWTYLRQKWLVPMANAVQERKKVKKEEIRRKSLAESRKKILQKQRKLLYNSSVSEAVRDEAFAAHGTGERRAKRMAATRKKRKKRMRLPLALVRIFFVLAVVSMGVAYISNQVTISSQKQRLAAVMAQLEQQQTENQELDRIVNGDADGLVERVARDSYNYAAPNERVFVDVSGN